jgi:hypothetical protein
MKSEERTMKNLFVGVALAAVVLGVVISNPGVARADATGDENFCLGVWKQVADGTWECREGDLIYPWPLSGNL